MDGLSLGGMFKYAGIGLAEHRFIEAFAKAFCRFCHLFLDFVIDFGEMVFDQNVGAVAFL